MNDFDYYNPTKIIFGVNRISAIRFEIPKDANVLLMYGQESVKSNGIYNEIIEILTDYNIWEFSGIKPNPTYEYLVDAMELIKQENINFILAVGGGSVIDAAKFVSVASFLEDSWKEMSYIKRYTKKIPVGVILTLPATGSEMNGSFVVTRESDCYKRLFLEPAVYPLFSVLDPRVVLSLPSNQIANGVVDAFSHVIEQYITYPSASYLQDGYAETILRTLIEIGPKIIKNTGNYDLNSNFMWCTTMALNKLIGSGVPQDWSSHMIGQELTALYGIDHACTLAIILPSLLNVQKQQKLDKLGQYAKNVWNITDTSKNSIADKVIERTEQFFHSLGIKTKLHEYGVTNASQIIPDKMHKNGLLPLGEHLDIDKHKVEKILAMCT
ncbi:MAG: iron-containing alcohol dehydrogenase [Burkholderiales bacterium]|nr:iron-containing alcohol dehydrogenase [Burkholderiales bacterium]